MQGDRKVFAATLRALLKVLFYGYLEHTLQQISNHIFCDDFIAGLELENRLMPNPYLDYPYLVIPRFFTPGQCRSVLDHACSAGAAEEAKIKAMKRQSVTRPKLDRSIRKTKILELSDPLLTLYDRRFRKFQPLIERHFSIALTTATDIQALQYTRGDFYIRHADDSSEVIDDAQQTVGFVQVAPQRRITTVLFATSHEKHAQDDEVCFSGGELLFNYLSRSDGSMVSYTPQAGDLIAFPSNPLFSHEVTPVTSGYRLTLVQWHNGITG
jgi:SM-20-related protein